MLIHSWEKSGTTSLPQDLTRDASLWPLATRPLVKRTQLIAWEVVSSQFPSLTATTNLSNKPGDNLDSKSMRLRDTIASLTSTEWTSLEIRHALWSKSGTLSLRLLFKPRPLMATFSECSLLLSQREPRDKSRPPASQRTLTNCSLERRWWRLCKLPSRKILLRTSSRSCK